MCVCVCGGGAYYNYIKWLEKDNVIYIILIILSVSFQCNAHKAVSSPNHNIFSSKLLTVLTGFFNYWQMTSLCHMYLHAVLTCRFPCCSLCPCAHGKTTPEMTLSHQQGMILSRLHQNIFHHGLLWKPCRKYLVLVCVSVWIASLQCPMTFLLLLLFLWLLIINTSS